MNPSAAIVSVARNGLKVFALQIQDYEGDHVTVTVTPEIGAVSPTGGVLLNTASGVYFNFNYIAPSTKPVPNTKKLIVTISDGPNLVTKTTQLYIY